MPRATRISDHYGRGGLMDRLSAALADDGADPERPTISELAPYDHFHGRGLEATEEMADALDVSAADHLLDVGCGVGGPARYLADRFGCAVTGIDLTEEFCDVARRLTRVLNLEDRVSIHLGDALAMPFAEARFDGAYSMNVSMNIADKSALYRELHRVLKPGAWLVLSEIAQGPAGHVSYPTPWAAERSASFLTTPEETRERLEAAGFAVRTARHTLDEALAFGARARAAVERGEKPPHRAVTLVHGADKARIMGANTASGLAAGNLVPIEIHCRKRT